LIERARVDADSSGEADGYQGNIYLAILTPFVFQILFHPFGRLEALYRRLQRIPVRFTNMRRNTLPAAGLFGSFRRPLADDAWHPAMKF
jgi:hypothetical protein